MSAFKRNIIYVDVTRGDCVDNNRKSGKSNTGTYFICSTKNFDDFEHFFKETNVYKFAIDKVDIYRVLFNEFFMSLKDEYVGKMENFNSTCAYLSSLYDNPTVEVGLRKNDSRIFMKFEDNSEPHTSAFRNILYEDLSLIAIEEIDGVFFIYPVVNEKYIGHKKAVESGLVFDED